MEFGPKPRVFHLCCILATVISRSAASGLCVPHSTQTLSCVYFSRNVTFCDTFASCGVAPGQCNTLRTQEKLTCFIDFRKEARTPQICITEQITYWSCGRKTKSSCKNVCRFDPHNCTDVDGNEWCELNYQALPGDYNNTVAITTTTQRTADIQVDMKNSNISENQYQTNVSNVGKSLIGAAVGVLVLAVAAVLIWKYRRQAEMGKDDPEEMHQNREPLSDGN